MMELERSIGGYMEKLEKILWAIWTCMRIVFFGAAVYCMMVTWQFYKGVENGKVAELIQVNNKCQQIVAAQKTGILEAFEDYKQCGAKCPEFEEKWGLSK